MGLDWSYSALTLKPPKTADKARAQAVVFPAEESTHSLAYPTLLSRSRDSQATANRRPLRLEDLELRRGKNAVSNHGSTLLPHRHDVGFGKRLLGYPLNRIDRTEDLKALLAESRL